MRAVSMVPPVLCGHIGAVRDEHAPPLRWPGTPDHRPENHRCAGGSAVLPSDHEGVKLALAQYHRPMTAGPDDHADDLRTSSDPADFDLDWISSALSERSYWAHGRGRSVVERSIANSLGFAALMGGRQVGFARVVTDQATFAWICDVFVDESARGLGIGKRLMAAIVADPRLAGLKRMMLATDDAHGLYAKFGFQPLEHPDKWMVRPGPQGAGADVELDRNLPVA